MPILPGDRALRVHFSGVGGTAMVAGARLAIEAGCEVRGSDGPLYPPTSTMVEALGVPVATGYRAENLDWRPDLVVIGNALSRGNTEVEAALERRLHYVSLPEWLKDAVLRRRRPVVICGTHGKTTTTAIAAYLLDRAGLEPGFLVGGQPLDFPHSARLSAEGRPFVIEGDEYDTAFFDKRAKFFHYLPEVAVVTSVEFDHGDIYRDLGEIDRTFRWMLRQIPRDGALVLCADHPGAAALAPSAYSEVVTYGFAADAEWRGESKPAEGGARLTVFHRGAPWCEVLVPMAGRHNLCNTLAAIAVAARFGAKPEAVAGTLPGFRGVRRRMEVFLEARGVVFVDDFAHHPTAIRETIRGARERWPGRRLRVLFEPRSNTTVTNRYQADLEEAFAIADEVWLGPIHRAEHIPEDIRLNRETIIAGLARRGVSAACLDDCEQLARAVFESARAGDVVLIMSNGAFGGVYEHFRRLAASDPA